MSMIDSVEDTELRRLLIQARQAATERRHGASVRLLTDAEKRACYLFMPATHPLRAGILATITAQQIKERERLAS